MRRKGLNYWLKRITECQFQAELNGILIGEALCVLKGLPSRKGTQLWKADPDAVDCPNFTAYCFLKWPNLSRAQITYYIRAYEIAQALEGKVPADEAVLPLSNLKSERLRQQAWEWANKDKRGEKVTAKDTLAAVEMMTTITNIATKTYKDIDTQRKAGLKADQELAEYSEQGISTKDAFILVDKCWRALVQATDDQRAEEPLARIFIEYLQTRYRTLKD